MHPEVKIIDWLEHGIGTDPSNVGFNLMVGIGVAGEDGADWFDFWVTTPKAIIDLLSSTESR